jgi:pheromone a factor receptor
MVIRALLTPSLRTSEYIVQGHRFNIYEQVGCFPATFNTAPAYPLVFMWPVVLGLVSFVFCGTYLFPKLLADLTLTIPLQQL